MPIKIIKIILFQCMISLSFASSQTLKIADSLFASKDYTEAFKLYESILDENKVSNAMLLKMAFIKEGLNESQLALYYLDLYYKRTADRDALIKINQLTETLGISGYSYTDKDYFKALIKKNIRLIIISVVLILLVTTTLLLVLYIKIKRKSPLLVSLQLFVLAILFALNLFYFENKPMGIILEDNSLVRNAPSTASDSITVIKRGNKIEILEWGDVWTKIKWGKEENGYIRNQRISII